MFSRLTRRGAGTAMFLAGTALCMTIVGLQTGCSTSNGAYTNPTPAISAFTGVLLDSGVYKAANLRIPVGGSATLRASFGVKDGTAVVTPGNIEVVSNKPFTIYSITQTTTYTLTVTAGDGTKTTSTCTVTVLPPPTNLAYTDSAPAFYKDVKIAADTATVAGGGTYSYSVKPDLPAGLTLNTSTGAITGTPTAVTPTATYVVTAKDEVNQSTDATLTIGVADTPLTFKLSPTAIAPGGGSILTWKADSVTGVFTNVSIAASPVDGSLPTSFELAGTANVHPAVTTTYTITATPATGGAPVVRTAGLTVGNAPLAITSFTAAPTQTTFGGATQLSWSYTGVPLSLTLDGADVLGLEGQNVVPVRRQTYTLTGQNTLNATPATATLSVAARGLDTFVGGASMGNVDGVGTAAKFTFATSLHASATTTQSNLSFDPDGNLLVVDYVLHTLRTVSPTGYVKTIAGRPGQTGPYNTPWTSAAPAAGPGLTVLMDRPSQVVAWDSNTYYAVDGVGQTLRKLVKQPDGTWLVSVVAGTPAVFKAGDVAYFDNPSSVCIYNDKVYLWSAYDGTIRVYNPADGTCVYWLQTGAYGYLDGTATAAKVHTPSSLTVDPATGDFYFTDRENHAIRKVTQAGVVTTIAGSYPTLAAGNADGVGTAAMFNRPCSIVWAGNNTLYVSDYNNHAIRKLVFSGGQWNVTTVAGTPGTAGYADGTGSGILFNGPEGIAVDASGNLYVQDSLNNCIRKLTASGGTFTSAPFAGIKATGNVDGSLAAAKFNGPNGAAADGQGNVYVADELNKTVRKVTPDGAVSTVATSGITFTAPVAVSVDNASNLYVLDRISGGHRVVKIPASGSPVALTLTGTGYAATSTGPRSLVVTPNGSDLFLADNTTLRKFSLGTLAQTATLAGLGSCQGLAVANDGVYWVEYSNAIVKKAALDLTGATLVAGVSGGKGFLDGATGTGKLNNPVALALRTNVNGDAAFVYVADQANHAIRKIDLSSGTMSTLVGAADTGISAAGAPALIGCNPGVLGVSASVYSPKGLAINAAGDLFVTTSDGVMQVTAP